MTGAHPAAKPPFLAFRASTHPNLTNRRKK
jgi:hypothetical protein